MTLLRSCRLDHSLPVVVGVSGGPDSICLADLFERLGYPVIIAHFDHQLRPESGWDAEMVERYAKEHGLPFRLGRLDVASFARSQRLSIEEAARTARYRFLFEQARLLQAQAVAVGHTADDQVETVLMHLLRGAGLSGLSGMGHRICLAEWDDTIPLVRPLLDTWRTEVLDYCAERGLMPLTDPTNQDTTYFRNRLRHDLIPHLQTYNPNLKAIIWRMARSLATDRAELERALEPAWQGCLVEGSKHYLVFSWEALQELSESLKHNLLRRAIAHLRPGLRDIDFDTVERAASFIESPTRSGQLELADQLYLLKEGGRLFLAETGFRLPAEDFPQMEPGEVLLLPHNGTAQLSGGWQIRNELLERESFGQPKAESHECYLDASRLVDPLTVRTPRPGERFRPLGMDGHTTKLSDFWVNHGLARRLRQGWPLVCAGDQVAWVVAQRPDHDYRVTAETRVICHMVVTKDEPDRLLQKKD